MITKIIQRSPSQNRLIERLKGASLNEKISALPWVYGEQKPHHDDWVLTAADMRTMTTSEFLLVVKKKRG